MGRPRVVPVRQPPLRSPPRFGKRSYARARPRHPQWGGEATGRAAGPHAPARGVVVQADLRAHQDETAHATRLVVPVPDELAVGAQQLAEAVVPIETVLFGAPAPAGIAGER